MKLRSFAVPLETVIREEVWKDAKASHSLQFGFHQLSSVLE